MQFGTFIDSLVHECIEILTVGRRSYIFGHHKWLISQYHSTRRKKNELLISTINQYKTNKNHETRKSEITKINRLYIT